MFDEITSLLDEVAKEANQRKINIGLIHGFSLEEMNQYLTDCNYRKQRKNDIGRCSLSWFRRRKNQDIKDKFTLAGIRKHYAVRAEKTMGAAPEYQSQDDQNNFNRFDLSWEKYPNSREFALAMEIEMDKEHGSIFKDFKKLVMNKKTDYKVMVCQADSESSIKPLLDKCHNFMLSNNGGGKYLISSWDWELGRFVHYKI